MIDLTSEIFRTDCTLVCASRGWGGKSCFLFIFTPSYIDTSVLTSLSHTLISLFLPDKHYDLGYIMFSIFLCVYVMEMLCEMLVLFIHACAYLS